MQRFIKTLAYGFAAAALTVVSVSPALAQKGQHGGGGPKGGGSTGMSFKSGPPQTGKFGSPTNVTGMKVNGGGNAIKTQGMPHQTNFNHNQNGIKNVQPGLAKGNPGFKKPGEFHNTFAKGKFFNDYCGTTYCGKGQFWCNNWKGCSTNWWWNCGSYPYLGGYCWPKSCWYPWYSCSYPVYCTSYCLNPVYTVSTPLYLAQPVYVPTVAQEVPVAPPVEEVTATTTVVKQGTRPALPSTGDLSFLTGSVLNQ